MHLRLLLPGLACALLISGCQTATINSHHDAEVDFSSFKTYAWIEAGEVAEWTPPEHLDIRFRRVVDEILETKGLERAITLPKADLLLVYYVSIESEIRVSTVPYGNTAYQYGYWSNAPIGYGEIRRIREGTLVLDVIDRETKQAVWTGRLDSAIKKDNPSGERITVVAERLLADFPPN